MIIEIKMDRNHLYIPMNFISVRSNGENLIHQIAFQTYTISYLLKNPHLIIFFNSNIHGST